MTRDDLPFAARRQLFLMESLGKLTHLWSEHTLDDEQQALCWQAIQGILLHLEENRPAFEDAMEAPHG